MFRSTIHVSNRILTRWRRHATTAARLVTSPVNAPSQPRRRYDQITLRPIFKPILLTSSRHATAVAAPAISPASAHRVEVEADAAAASAAAAVQGRSAISAVRSDI
jgi:hypothetical protein